MKLVKLISNQETNWRFRFSEIVYRKPYVPDKSQDKAIKEDAKKKNRL